MFTKGDVCLMSNKNVSTQVRDQEEYFTSLTTLPEEITTWFSENQKDVFIVSDLFGSVVFVSDSIERLLGYEKELFIEQDWEKIVPKKTAHYIRQQIENDAGSGRFTVKFRHPNGHDLWLKCTVHKLIIDDTKEPFCILALKDITANKKAEQFMIQAEKMSIVNQISAGIAHEIRNPLTALKGFLQLLESGVDGKKEYFRIMMDELNKIEKTTSELLFLSKPMTNEYDTFLLAEIISDIVELFRLQALEKEIHFNRLIDQEVEVYCDPTQIKQVFINIIKNAIEGMHYPGTITITCEKVGKFVHVDVKDEGEGIAEDILHKLNEPFFTTKEHGTGLGLVVTRQIIEEHNGLLDVFSNKEIGTTFRISLPRLQ